MTEIILNQINTVQLTVVVDRRDDRPTIKKFKQANFIVKHKMKNRYKIVRKILY